MVRFGVTDAELEKATSPTKTHNCIGLDFMRKQSAFLENLLS